MNAGERITWGVLEEVLSGLFDWFRGNGFFGVEFDIFEGGVRVGRGRIGGG